MRVTFKISLIVVILGNIVLSSCKEEDIESPMPVMVRETVLADSQMVFLETVKDTLIRLEDILLENGQNVRSFLEANDPGFLRDFHSYRTPIKTSLTPTLQKLLFFSRILLMGQYLVDRSKHTYPDEGADKPAQNGLAYSWGSKDCDIRQVPPGHGGECSALKIYGLDCTGMIWVMTTGARLAPVASRNYFCVDSISDPKKWTLAFKTSEEYKGLRMKNMGSLNEDQLKNGDILLWGSHVGIFLNGFLYQSNGSRRLPDCNINLSPNKGPRLISLAEILHWGLGPYKVFRVVEGDDYTLTVELNLKGFSMTSYCKLDNYTESAAIHVTVMGGNNVRVNNIINVDPEVTHQASADCKCLEVSFINGSWLKVTDFYGNVNNRDLSYHLVYTFCPPTEVYQCVDSPTAMYYGLVVPGIEAGGTIPLPLDPADSMKVALPIWNGGTLTIRKDEL